jgi:hypothetical protein
MNNERCETCRCWRASAQGAIRGLCRRYPPMPAVLPPDSDGDDSHAYSHWAETAVVNWCGEWQPKPEEDRP